MGCDIHSFAEVKREGRWEVVSDVFPFDDWERDYFKRTHGHEPFRTRNYTTFCLFAGVRCREGMPTLAAAKGLPADVSGPVREASDLMDSDGHSHSWLTLRELLDGADAIAQCRDWMGGQFDAHLDVLKTLGEPDDVRIVFWFDN